MHGDPAEFAFVHPACEDRGLRSWSARSTTTSTAHSCPGPAGGASGDREWPAAGDCHQLVVAFLAEDGVITPPCWGALLGGSEPLAAPEPPGLQPASRVRGSTRVRRVDGSARSDRTPRSSQRADPQPFGVLAAQRVEDGLDRVMTASSWPKPRTSGVRTGPPTRVPPYSWPGLKHPIEDHRNSRADRVELCTSLRYARPLDRQGAARKGPRAAARSIRSILASSVSAT